MLVHKFIVDDLWAFLYVFILQLKTDTYCITMGKIQKVKENTNDNQGPAPRASVSDTTF